MNSTRTAAVLLPLSAALTLTALGAALGTTAASAVAPVQVRIYLENNNHNPGSVTTLCGPDGPEVHTALFNDANGANVVETAVVYAEPADPKTGLGDVVAGPVDVPIGGHVDVVLPVSPGVTFDAVAVAKGDPLPTSVSDLIARLSAKPPTADNSQLFPSGYPAIPADCPEPKPTSTSSESSSESSTSSPKPTHSSSSSSASQPSSSMSVVTTPAGSGSSSSVAVAASSAASAKPAGGLAHTGATVLPYAAGAVVLIGAGAGFVVYTRKQRPHRTH